MMMWKNAWEWGDKMWTCFLRYIQYVIICKDEWVRIQDVLQLNVSMWYDYDSKYVSYWHEFQVYMR